MVTRWLQAERRTGSVRRPKTGVLLTVLCNQPGSVYTVVAFMIKISHKTVRMSKTSWVYNTNCDQKIPLFNKNRLRFLLIIWSQVIWYSNISARWKCLMNTSLSFVGWHRSCVPSWRMYAGYRRWLPSSAVCWQLNVLGQENTQPVQWLLFCHRWANTVEQSAWTASATGHHLRAIQTVVENVYVWLVGERRPVSER